MALLFLAFLVVPLAELAVIVRVDAALGLGPTIALLLFDSLVGAYLVRREGRRAWDRFRQALEAARWPGDEVAQGALLLVGGALLLTPGFLTDGVGLALVLPPTRRLLAARLRGRMAGRTRRSGLRIEGFGIPGTDDPAQRSWTPPDRRRDPPEVLDVEVVSVEREEPGDPDGRPDDGAADPPPSVR